jgi:hypothetical protein
VTTFGTINGGVTGALTNSSKSSKGLLLIVTGFYGKLIPENLGNGKDITSG